MLVLILKQPRGHRMVLTTCAMLVSTITFARGADRYWVGPSAGSWSDPQNWSETLNGQGGAGVPQTGDVARFESTFVMSTNFDYQYDQPGIFVNLKSQTHIHQTVPSSRMIVTSSLSMPDFQNSGVALAVYNQSAGASIVNNNLNLGWPFRPDRNLQGYYTLSGDAMLNVGSSLFVRNGTFTQTGGVCSIAGGAELGDPFSSTPGGIDMSGGTLAMGYLTQLVGTSTFSAGKASITGNLNFFANASVVLSGGLLSVGSIDLDSGNAQMIQDGGVLIVSTALNVSTGAFYRYNAGSLSAGSVDLAGGQFLMGPGPAKVARTGGISITGNGKMDIADAAAIVDHEGASPISTIRGYIASGYNNGSWNGDGINSSMAASNPGHAVGFAEASAIFTSFPAIFRGHEVDDTTVIIAHTRYGDADLNGFVSLDDFNRLAANFGTPAGAVWSQADFNFDGMVNLADFDLLAGNFGLAAAPDGPTPEDWSTLAAAVPEPGVLCVLPIAAMLRRRHRARVKKLLRGR